MPDVNRSKFRIINAIETNMLKKGLNDINPNVMEILKNEGFTFMLSLKKDFDILPMIFLISEQIFEIYKKIQENESEIIVDGGIYFGYFKRGLFFLSLEGAELLYQYRIFSDKNIVIINEDGEKSLLYGNDLIKKMVIKYPKEINKGDLILIVNKNKELIALGNSLIEGKAIENNLNNKVALNLVDKGYYLREEQ